MTCTRAHETPIEDLLAAPESPECVDFLQHCEICEACSAELARQRSRVRGAASSKKMLVVGFAVALTALVLLATDSWREWVGLGVADQSQSDGVPVVDSRSGEIHTMAATPTPDILDASTHQLVSGQTIEISIDPDRRSQPVAFSLRLGEGSTNDEPRSVRLIATDGRVLELDGVLANDRMSASIDVPAEFLLPGRYLVEVKTTEATHFPLRRYVVVVQSARADAE